MRLRYVKSTVPMRTLALMSQVDDVPRGTLGTVRNATLLLELLAQGAAFQQLTELAERSGLSLPTVHRLLRSLVAAGLVEQDPDSARYGLAPELVRLAERYLSRLPIFRLAGLPVPRRTPKLHGRDRTAALLVRVRSSTSTVLTAPTPRHLSASRAACTPPLETAAGRLLIGSDRSILGKDAVAASRNGSLHARRPQAWAKASYVVLVDNNSLAEVAVPILTD